MWLKYSTYSINAKVGNWNINGFYVDMTLLYVVYKIINLTSDNNIHEDKIAAPLVNIICY